MKTSEEQKINIYLIFFIYVVAGILWVILSDYILLDISSNFITTAEYHKYQGWLSIAVSSIFILFLLHWYKKNLASQSRLRLETENKFKLLFEDAPNPYQSLNSDGKIVAVNKKWLETLGYEKEDEVVGHWFGDMLAPEYVEHFRQNFPKFKDKGSIHGVEFNMLHKDGHPIPVLFHGQIDYDENHSMLQTHCAFEDVSDRNKVKHLNGVLSVIRDVNQLIVREKDIEKILQESCNILTSNHVFEHAWIMLFNDHNQIEYITGSDNSEEFKSFRKKIQNGWTPHCIDAIKTKHSFIEDTEQTCKECPLKDIYNTKGGFSIELKYDNKLYGYLNISVDKKYIADDTELSLLDEVAGDIAYALYNIHIEERYHYVLDDSIEGLWDLNLVTNQIYFSPRWKEMLGYSDDEMENSFESWESRLNPDDAEQTFLAMKMTQEGETKRFVIPHRLKHKDGHWVWIESRGQTIYDKNGKAIRMLGSHRDITDKKLLELELHESYETLHKLTESVPGAIYQFRLNPDGSSCFPYASKGIEDIYEASPENLRKDASLAYKNIHPDDLSIVTASIEESALRIKEWNLEYRVNLPMRGVRWVHGQSKPEKLEDGSIVWHGFLSDITDKILAQESAKQRDEMLTSVFDAIPDLLFIMEKDGTITDYRAMLDSALYVESSVFLGKKMQDVLPPKIGKLFSNNVQNLSKEKSLQIFQYELEVENEIRYFEARIAKLPINEHIMAIVRDVTEQTSDQQQLSFQATLLEQSLAATNVIDENGLFSFANDAYVKMWGYNSKEEILGTSPISHCQDPLMPQKIIQEVEKDGQILMEFKARRKDGTTFDALMAVTYINMYNKKHYIGSTMDITELKQKDEMLINQSRHAAMGEMIGMIAHQWRQPLTAISMDANNMFLDIAMGNLDMNQTQEYAKSISGQTQHLSQTIDDFRNFFKPDKEISQVNIKDIFNQTLTIVKDSLKNNNIELKSTFETQQKVNAYPRELMQVFVNIITNAKDVLVSNKTQDAVITVRVYEDEEYINTEICDNGGGIDATILPKVFDPYFSTKDAKTGTGLGLYMSKMIIEDHLNGVIDADNNDDGACFRVGLLKEKMEG